MKRKNSHITDTITPSIQHCHYDNIADQFSKFWEIEDCSSGQKELSSIESACVEHFKQNVIRTPEGPYMAHLPFNDQKDQLGTTRSQSLRQLYALQRRFKQNPRLQEDYTAIIEEYKQRGYLKKVENEKEEGFYLSHHPVFKDDSLTTKVRMVLNGSQLSSTKVSLNHVLMNGPINQNDLFTILILFRLDRYVFVGDIEKMFLQVLITPADRKYLRILWLENGEVVAYEFQVLPFGLISSTYLATAVLDLLAEDEKDNYPLAVRVIRERTYVDDANAGADSVEELLEIRDQLIGLLKAGGFTLRKCASNVPEALEGLPDCVVNLELLGGDDPTLKTLGIGWHTKQDKLIYTVQPIATKERITMRTIASDVARIFDPYGLLNPVIAHAKIIQQELWRLKLNWDDSLPLEICTRWKEFAAQLPLLDQIEFPRWPSVEDRDELELHGFSDASEKAYGACFYLRSTSISGKTEVHLLCAKSRITPLKGSPTIPRLELCAAELLSQLYTKLIKINQLKNHKVTFWPDSTITLHWINKSTHELQRFVANRVAKIQERTNPQNWRHVRTHDNPADAISRGQLPKEFLENSLWKHGPHWLTGGESDWPESVVNLTEEVPELKKSTCLITTSKNNKSDNSSMNNEVLSRFSSFYKLQRFVARCLRLTNKCSEKFLTVRELEAARQRILLIIQRAAFQEEFECLNKNQPVPNRSKLQHLSPFIDKDGLIRVGGRIHKSKTIGYDARHTIVLPPTHHITHLLIEQAHTDNLHTGTQTTLHIMRQTYWPIDGRRQIRKLINKCVTCIRYNPPEVSYQMANLPEERITQANPFKHTGVDYCGPFYIKEKKHRNRNKIKVWIAIFVCFSVKAVHIEVVDDMSTQEFLAAFSRFLSRHPTCHYLYSDNGTNFVGAKNELAELSGLINSDEHNETIQRTLAKQNIHWNFIPPHAPHCGGLWEAAVKSFKYHLRRVLKDELPTYQQLNTLCIKIEGILNSRPLTPLSSDPNDLSALTPSQFLYGATMRDVPSPDFLHTPSNRLSYWEHLEKMKQEFWERWHKEYLSELQLRYKWTDGSHGIKTGSLVLIREDNTPPLHWRMGRIIQTYPGNDGIIRKVQLKTSNGIFERNVKKLVLLPID